MVGSSPIVHDRTAVLYRNGETELGSDRSLARFPHDDWLQVLAPGGKRSIHLASGREDAARNSGESSHYLNDAAF